MIELNHIYAGPSIHKTEGNNAHEMLVSILDEYPSAKPTEIAQKFWERILDDEECLKPCVIYFALNMINNISGTNRRNKKKKKKKEDVDAAAAAALADKIRSVVILDLILPNGKTARESTFADLAKAGGLWTGMSKLGKPKQIVGKHVTDEQAQKLYRMNGLTRHV